MGGPWWGARPPPPPPPRPPPAPPKTGWIGQNSPGVEVRISDEGEVQVRSGATMVGYYKEPEKT
ncbi:hypothetical protein I5F71_31995, partial [Pseudomonas aeruginosa]|nr:hypothetical protein [Pseudomonas aeruginosa]